MTLSEMKAEIARKSGIPRNVVALVLDTQEDIITECILSRETCYIGSILTIRSWYRDFKVMKKPGVREVVKKLVVNVKPRAGLRRRMNDVDGKIRRTYK